MRREKKKKHVEGREVSNEDGSGTEKQSHFRRNGGIFFYFVCRAVTWLHTCHLHPSRIRSGVVGLHAPLVLVLSWYQFFLFLHQAHTCHLATHYRFRPLQGRHDILECLPSRGCRNHLETPCGRLVRSSLAAAPPCSTVDSMHGNCRHARTTPVLPIHQIGNISTR